MQVEAFLRSPKLAIGNDVIAEKDIQILLLGILADLILDAGTPPTCDPYLTSLFQSFQPAAQTGDTARAVGPRYLILQKFMKH